MNIDESIRRNNEELRSINIFLEKFLGQELKPSENPRQLYGKNLLEYQLLLENRTRLHIKQKIFAHEKHAEIYFDIYKLKSELQESISKIDELEYKYNEDIHTR